MSWLAYTGLALITAGAYYLIGKYSRQLFDHFYRLRPYGNGRR